ncbi:hypothetical protein NEF87_001464 [Candidatus Lokiarchaeum ossiferum]|uniref:Uncharacterized protein n=1 Tax=Candidatus Lokiarchaeum ossiferum TaxID=2951803 RepID=A0ABY6HRT4_9ARCH|nr:hypothetical protein NEF87_001464 [Candidatus Lokiarchaeum sp. B-35]
MGIREIEDRAKMRDLMKKKAAELRMHRLATQTATTKMTKEKLAEIAKKHGVIVALDPEMKEIIEEIRKKYNIPKERIIREEITEESVLKKGKKVDIKKLAMLSYQRVMLEKQETGGLLTLPDVFDMINTGSLKNRITMDDTEKAVKILKKDKVIPEIKKLPSGILAISFFPVQYTKDQTSILELVTEDGVITTGDVCKALNWTVERAERALQNLVDTRVARITETFRTGKKYFFPSLKTK